jgi:hypothetical protein
MSNRKLTPEEIEEQEGREKYLKWKEKYWNLYYTEIDGEEFLFRELSRLEYRTGIRLYEDDSSSLEEYICRTCVLEPEDYDYEDCPSAGLPTSLSTQILYESGFLEDTGKMDEYITKYRKEMDSPDNVITCMIKEAFQELTLDEIESWPMQKTIWYFARAEYILREFRGVQLTSNVEEPQPDVKETKPARAFTTELVGEDSAASDFSELGEINAFMKGKWNPPPVLSEGDELI